MIRIEDKRFFSHYGVDIRAKVAALYENYTAGSTVRGGSTLTEQYIKNTYFPDAKRTIWQKIHESIYALIMEMKYTKEDILKKYIDSIYM
jgi:penicillin-binding protein 1A